jgi:glycosyltransferase involved in cell wall biosynthesis
VCDLVFLPPANWPAIQPEVNPDTTLDAEVGRRRLVELGANVRVVNPFGFPWNPLARKGGYLCGLDPLRALRVLFTCRKASAIIGVTESSALVLLLLRRLFFFKPKIILWDASLGNPWGFLHKVQKLVFPRADGFLMLTQRQCELMRSHDRIRGEVVNIGYYVDDQFFHPKYSVGEEYILSVGDDRTRDYDTLIEAVRGLTDTPVTLKTRWRPTTTAPAHVTFIDRRMSDTEFRDLYARAKLVVIPLHVMDSPGGVTALFEAMAMGKPVIVTESSISRDFVTHGSDAWVVPPNDVNSLREVITKLSTDESLRQSLGAAARQTIQSKFSSRQAAQKQLDAILRIVTGK